MAGDAPAAARWRKRLPILDWGRRYDRETLTSDMIAAAIVTIMLIPQSLAYALLAGLPAQVGLYASMLPLVAYALFGASRALAVGPVAVVSLMTAAAVGEVAAPGTPEYLGAAMALALLSGLFLVALGMFRLGFLANFLSHPVISGFIAASAVIIAASQIRHLLGIPVEGHNLPDLLLSFVVHAGDSHVTTAVIGVAAMVLLVWVRRRLKPRLIALGASPRFADLCAKVGPVAAVALSTLAVSAFDLAAAGVKTVGAIPGGLPSIGAPAFDAALWRDLLVPAILISVIGFVESVSVAQTLAAKKRQRIDPDQELIGLGAANLAAAVSGGYPVTGGFARSVVNFDAGAATPAAGAFTAVGIALATLFLTPLLHDLPRATLAATIIVAVLSLVDAGAVRRTWIYSKTDFAAMAATILCTLAMGVEQGVVAGVALSLALHLHRTSRPHYAIVGQAPGTEHFRNVLRHPVTVSDAVLSIRIDESLYFANARYLEEVVLTEVARRPTVRHVVLMCSAVNLIDASALESLEMINLRLKAGDIAFHLSEVKGPVMDRLLKVDFLQHLTGEVFRSHFEAIRTLAPESLT